MHSRRSIRKLEKERGQEDEEEDEVEMEEEVEEEIEVMEEEEREMEEDAEAEKKLEVHARFSEEYLWDLLDFSDGDEDESKIFRPRFTSIVSPSLSPTPPLSGTPSLTWSQTPPEQSESTSSSTSSQKSTAHPPPLPLSLPCRGRADPTILESSSTRVSLSKYRPHFTHSPISVPSVKNTKILAER